MTESSSQVLRLEVIIMRGLVFLSVLLLAACSNDPVEKSPNGSPNNANNTTGTNNTIGPNNTTSNNCVNVSLQACPLNFIEVDTCPEGAYCEEILQGCGADLVCARVLGPETYRNGACASDPDCDANADPCAVDEDCALVSSGDFCGCLECPSDAIERVNEAAYTAHQEQARNRCDSLAPCGDAPCVEYVAHCNLETFECEGRQTKYVTTEGLDDGCEVASDCAPVFEGEVCDACMCPNEAIPADLVETYRSAFDVECAHGVACDCPAYEVRCNEGMCELGPPPG